MIDSFRKYLTLLEVSYQKNGGDIEDTLKKIPKAHKELLKSYHVDFQGDNTLKGDGQSVGSLDIEKNKIDIAAPWNYGREWTFLHEIGHLVYEKYIRPNEKLEDEWKKIVKHTKDKVKQNSEELFCHAYANTYSKNKIERHNHPEWDKFISNLKK